MISCMGQRPKVGPPLQTNAVSLEHMTTPREELETALPAFKQSWVMERLIESDGIKLVFYAPFFPLRDNYSQHGVFTLINTFILARNYNYVVIQVFINWKGNFPLWKTKIIDNRRDFLGLLKGGVVSLWTCYPMKTRVLGRTNSIIFFDTIRTTWKT